MKIKELIDSKYSVTSLHTKTIPQANGTELYCETLKVTAPNGEELELITVQEEGRGVILCKRQDWNCPKASSWDTAGLNTT